MSFAYDSCFFVKRGNIDDIFISLYVNDLLIACSSPDLVLQEKEELSKQLEIIDFGEAKSCLGIGIAPDQNKVS